MWQERRRGLRPYMHYRRTDVRAQPGTRMTVLPPQVGRPLQTPRAHAPPCLLKHGGVGPLMAWGGRTSRSCGRCVPRRDHDDPGKVKADRAVPAHRNAIQPFGRPRHTSEALLAAVAHIDAAPSSRLSQADRGTVAALTNRESRGRRSRMAASPPSPTRQNRYEIDACG